MPGERAPLWAPEQGQDEVFVRRVAGVTANQVVEALRLEGVVQDICSVVVLQRRWGPRPARRGEH